MKNKDLKKIEDKISDIEVSDGVLDRARAEMQNSGVKQKTAVRFNYKILLSCAASFVLCLAIILPITLSSFRNSNKYSESDNSSSDVPQAPSESPPDISLAPGGELPPDISQVPGDESPPSVSDPSAPSKIMLAELVKTTIYSIEEGNETGSHEPAPPSAENPTDREIVYKFHYKYSFENSAIISEEKYSVDGCECIVYTLYDMKYTVDVLEEFTQFNSEYTVENIKFNYKISTNYYLADVIYGQKRYCFKLKNTEQSVFEMFCKYLSEKIST